MTLRRRLMFLTVLLIGTSTAFATNDVRRPIPVDSLLGMTFITALQPLAITPDGRSVAFIVEDRRLKQPTDSSNAPYEGCRIVLVDTLSGKISEITPSGMSAWMPSWSPDGSRLAFFAGDKNGTHVWIWSASGLRRVTRAPLSIKSPFAEIYWLERRNAIIVPVFPAETEAVPHTDERAETSSRLTVEVRISPHRAGEATSALRPSLLDQHLLRIDLQDGSSTEVSAASEGIAAISPDGERFVHAVGRRDIQRRDGVQYQSYSDLWLETAKGDKPVRIAEAIPLAFPLSARISWSPDGQFVAYRTLGLPAERKVVIAKVSSPLVQQRIETKECPVANFVHEAPLWKADSSAVIFPDGDSVLECSFGKGPRTIARIEGVQLGNVLKRTQSRVWSPIGRSAIWVLGRSAARAVDALYEIDPQNGTATTVVESRREIGDLARLQVSASDNGDVVVFPSESASEPADLWIIRGGQRPKRLTTLNPAISDLEMGKQELLEWTNSAGVKERALVLLPAGYVHGRQYPTIVWVYQQATSSYANTFGLSGSQFYNLQMFATRGYAVLFPDIAWKPGAVMRGIAEQVLPAVDQLVQRGISDPGRVGVIGHSSGGYDVLSLLVQTNRFRAAMESNGVGIYDLASQFAGRVDTTTSADWVTKQMGVGAPPWKAPQTYVNNSPGYHLDQITTPLLMLEGLSDTSDNVAQSEYLFSALNWLGKTVEYRRYPAEQHAPEWWSPVNKRDGEVRMLNWFAEYLGGTGAGN